MIRAKFNGLLLRGRLLKRNWSANSLDLNSTGLKGLVVPVKIFQF